MSDAIAILVFARPTTDEAARKRLTPQAVQNRRVLNCLTERVTQTTIATGLPVLLSTELITHRGSFGEQFTSALQAAFDRGFERILVVGNDCPGLTISLLNHAADALRATPVVLGPDRRGGLYLLGLSRAAFGQNRLAGLPWQTPALSRATRRAFTHCPIIVLARLGDVNQVDDLQTYRTAGPGVGVFVMVLLALIRQRALPVFRVAVQPLTPADWPGGAGLRAPPAA